MTGREGRGEGARLSLCLFFVSLCLGLSSPHSCLLVLEPPSLLCGVGLGCRYGEGTSGQREGGRAKTANQPALDPDLLYGPWLPPNHLVHVAPSEQCPAGRGC